MPELLKFEYKRLLTCKPLYFILAAAAIIPLAAGIGVNIFFGLLGVDDFDALNFTSGNEQFFTWFVISFFHTRLPIFIALFTSLFLGRDFRDGFVRNKALYLCISNDHTGKCYRSALHNLCSGRNSHDGTVSHGRKS